ncbi:hypothetical protein JOQ06_029434, partial [Pogonophryne albipinna]
FAVTAKSGPTPPYMDRAWSPGQHKEGRQTRRIKQREGCVGPDEGVDGSASRRLQRPDGYWERDAQQ